MKLVLFHIPRVLAALSFLLLVLVGVAYGAPKFTTIDGPTKPGWFRIFVATKPSLPEAFEAAKTFQRNFKHTSIFLTRDAWYLISIGTVREAKIGSTLKSLMADGRIPSDSFVTNGDNLIRRYDLDDLEAYYRDPAKSQGAGAAKLTTGILSLSKDKKRQNIPESISGNCKDHLRADSLISLDKVEILNCALSTFDWKTRFDGCRLIFVSPSNRSIGVHVADIKFGNDIYSGHHGADKDSAYAKPIRNFDEPASSYIMIRWDIRTKGRKIMEIINDVGLEIDYQPIDVNENYLDKMASHLTKLNGGERVAWNTLIPMGVKELQKRNCTR